eukprot:TRINITY_DN4436_c0_g1_i1.p1 TRINITY_DN4436_c0_g1~~TRINITY_DN4436_c0_g1_i1.p1  ORF type:complete len:685 (+),score=127.43 TRINITY_DN4436_c0_g1_i1:305-2359(+)
MKKGKQISLVSSGSVGQGRQILRKQALLSTPLSKHITHHEGDHLPRFESRACASAGQSGMMAFYEALFGKKGIICSQILLADDEFIQKKKSHLKETLNSLMASGIIPIINENDVMSMRTNPGTGEHSAIFWDNDSLAALIAKEIEFDLLLLLTDVAGIYDRDPKEGNANIISVFRGVGDIVIGPKSTVGRGGMMSKIKAAVGAVDAGVPAVVIASGYEKYTISRILSGENVGTLFTLSTIHEPSTDLQPFEKAQAAKDASHVLMSLTADQRSSILKEMAKQIDSHRKKILDANDRDLSSAKRLNLEPALVARLKLTQDKLTSIILGINQLAESVDPVGRVVSSTQLANGLVLTKETTPMGVVMVIFESRPDVIPQLASLAIRSANGLLLKGGKESQATNKVLHSILSHAVSSTTQHLPTPVPKEIFGFVDTTDDVTSLLGLENLISLVVCRGSSNLVRHVQKISKIPVLGHSEGICHVYVHQDANISMAIRILLDAKLDFPAACNAMETLLLDTHLLGDGRATRILNALIEKGITIYGCPKVVKVNPNINQLTTSLSHQYSSPALTVVVVDSVEKAIEHINQWGSGHTDSIVTESPEVATQFLNDVDSACVFHNASTRFSDGYRFGLGAEVGVSTNRLHARGPVGVDGLMTVKWKLYSTQKEGSIVKEFTEGKEKYLHLTLSKL